MGRLALKGASCWICRGPFGECECIMKFLAKYLEEHWEDLK